MKNMILRKNLEWVTKSFGKLCCHCLNFALCSVVCPWRPSGDSWHREDMAVFRNWFRKYLLNHVRQSLLCAGHAWNVCGWLSMHKNALPVWACLIFFLQARGRVITLHLGLYLLSSFWKQAPTRHCFSTINCDLHKSDFILIIALLLKYMFYHTLLTVLKCECFFSFRWVSLYICQCNMIHNS